MDAGDKRNRGIQIKRKHYLYPLLFLGTLVIIISYWVFSNILSEADLEWYPFEWGSYRYGRQLIEKAGILVPIEIEGVSEKYWLQLDTGSHNQLYGVPFNELNFPYQIEENNGGLLSIKFAGKIAGFEIDRKFRIRKDYGSSIKNGPEKIGTLGSDYFDGKVLLLDYPRQRFSIARGIPENLIKKITFVKTKTSRRSFYLDIFLETVLNGKKIWLEFDTGTGLGAALLNRDNWREITGCELNSRDNIKIEAANFGNMISFVGRPAGGVLRLGEELLVERPVVYTSVTADLPQTLGNQLFLDYLVVVDLKNDRFGFIKSGGSAQDR